ncbi:MAG: DEAD/DEAH box helicase [Planctomycetota bacterium]|jgi:SNF2 family DNA or RNA helicase|nr:DEAD/DEAH box helicase [Planctomycetota bacterium]
MPRILAPNADAVPIGRTSGGIPVGLTLPPFNPGSEPPDPVGWTLRLEHARLKLLRGFDDLLCLEGLHGVEHMPHQIETVRRVLRYFRGRVLLADEVGLGKTIEACLLLREYLLRGLARRVLILTPAPLVTQWREELAVKFGLEFAVPDGTADAWASSDRLLSSIGLAKSRRHFAAVTTCRWDLVIVDEAHHCKNRNTLNWKLVNELKRRHLFLLTATPVQNDLIEMYNLLTLLEPGHLKTERDFRMNYVTRGNPRDPKNREKLRGLLGEVMIRNTRSLVNINLPPRYAQTFRITPGEEEGILYREVERYLRGRRPPIEPAEGNSPESAEERRPRNGMAGGLGGEVSPTGAPKGGKEGDKAANGVSPALANRLPPLSRMQINHLLMAAGSHPATLAPMLERLAASDPAVSRLAERARGLAESSKEKRLLSLLRERPSGKALVFACFSETLARLERTLSAAGIPAAVFSGRQTAAEKDEAVRRFRETVPVLLCSESGGEGRNLQFADTLVNFDLPWNPMRIEQRIGRVHRIGQTREVFVFNLAAEGTLESRILSILDDKIRMFELVVGEVGGILGNLDGGEEFETIVLDMWLRSASAFELDSRFDVLGRKLLDAQAEYLEAKKLDEVLFGDDFE